MYRFIMPSGPINMYCFVMRLIQWHEFYHFYFYNFSRCLEYPKYYKHIEFKSRHPKLKFYAYWKCIVLRN